MKFLEQNVISSFLDEIFKNLQKDKIDVSKYELDHICYRVSSLENYNFLKENIEKFGTLLAENMVAGRPIATIKLFSPIVYHNREISILEIPSPKAGSDYVDGFEHVEFVINESFEDFMKMYFYLYFETKDLAKKINPDIKIKYDNFSVKFHHDSLENLVQWEKINIL